MQQAGTPVVESSLATAGHLCRPVRAWRSLVDGEPRGAAGTPAVEFSVQPAGRVRQAGTPAVEFSVQPTVGQAGSHVVGGGCRRTGSGRHGATARPINAPE